MPELNITATRRALLQQIAAGDVFGAWHHKFGARYWLRRDDAPDATVTGRVGDLIDAGFARHGVRETTSAFSRFSVLLTEAGRRAAEADTARKAGE